MMDETDLPAAAAEQLPEPVVEEQGDHAAIHAVGEAIPILELPVGEERLRLVEAEIVATPLIAEDAMNGAPDGLPEEDKSRSPSASSGQALRDDHDKEEARGELVLEKKHPLAIRWMHWINFPVLFTMIWSGLLIYWNDSDNAYRHPHEVYRIGIGKLTLFRFFPASFYTNRMWDVRYKVTEGLGYHFFFMWLFAINGIAYVAYLVWSREWRFLAPHRESIKEAIQVTLVDLHLRKGLPAQTKYNGAQRIAYSAVIAMGLGSLVTGLAIYKPTEAHWLTSLLGGYEMARWLHFLLTMGFCGFFLVHVGQVILAGWNNFRAMVSGYEIRRRDEPTIEAERGRV